MSTALSKKDESGDSDIHTNVVQKQQQGALIFVVDKDIYFPQHCLVHPQYLLMSYTEQEENSFQVPLPTVLLVHDSNLQAGYLLSSALHKIFRTCLYFLYRWKYFTASLQAPTSSTSPCSTTVLLTLSREIPSTSFS